MSPIASGIELSVPAAAGTTIFGWPDANGASVYTSELVQSYEQIEEQVELEWRPKAGQSTAPLHAGQASEEESQFTEDESAEPRLERATYWSGSGEPQELAGLEGERWLREAIQRGLVSVPAFSIPEVAPIRVILGVRQLNGPDVETAGVAEMGRLASAGTLGTGLPARWRGLDSPPRDVPWRLSAATEAFRFSLRSNPPASPVQSGSPPGRAGTLVTEVGPLPADRAVSDRADSASLVRASDGLLACAAGNEVEGRLPASEEVRAEEVEDPSADLRVESAVPGDRKSEEHQGQGSAGNDETPGSEAAGPEEWGIPAATSVGMKTSAEPLPSTQRLSYSSAAAAAEHVRLLRQDGSLRSPVSNVVIEIEDAGAPPVRLRISSGAGPVRLEVHSPEETVRQALRADLNTLVSRLESAGYDLASAAPLAADAAELAVKAEVPFPEAVTFEGTTADGAWRNDSRPGRWPASGSERRPQRGAPIVRR